MRWLTAMPIVILIALALPGAASAIGTLRLLDMGPAQSYGYWEQVNDSNEVVGHTGTTAQIWKRGDADDPDQRGR